MPRVDVRQCQIDLLCTKINFKTMEILIWWYQKFNNWPVSIIYIFDARIITPAVSET